MAKFNVNDYEFINVSDESDVNVEALSANELEEMAPATLEVLKNDAKMKNTPRNLCLAAGFLAVRGGEFKKVVPIHVSYKKGSATKAELKIINRVFDKARLYYLINNFINMQIKHEQVGTDGIYAYLARKKG